MLMKQARQNAILELIKSRKIRTQEEISKWLNERGFVVTQATISRDIRELRITKTLGEDGSIYVLGDLMQPVDSSRMLRILKEAVLFIKSTGSIVVVGTVNGGAGAVAEVIDGMRIEGVLGCVAGDNTILVAVYESWIPSVIIELNKICEIS